MPTIKRMMQATKPNRRRYTKRQIEQRRQGVWEMLCCGQPIQEIAAHYHVTVKTIQRDISWWEEKLGYHTTALKEPENAAVDVGLTAAKLQKGSEEAYVEFAAASNPMVKAKFLDLHQKMVCNRHKILADAGYLPKVGHVEDRAPSFKISFESRFGKDAPQAVFDNDKSRRKVLEAVASAMALGIDVEPELPAIDVESTPVE